MSALDVTTNEATATAAASIEYVVFMLHFPPLDPPASLGPCCLGTHLALDGNSGWITPLAAWSQQNFIVSWAGQDNSGGSGLAGYDIYVSDNGGDYTVWLSGTSQTSALFTGQADHAYAFYSLARDIAGNLEAAPAGPDAETTVEPAQVTGRHVFYNRSALDGNDPAANANDDAAIAPDKIALLPAGTATFANYTSYSRGLNGIMVDIAGLPGTPTPADFEFKVGNSNDPPTWTTAPSPTYITVRPGEGIGGSDRVTIIWADNAVQNCWLQVTVKATANTGLATDDVFCFANQIGDAGGDGKVNIFDAFALNAAWGKGSGEAGYDIDTDFNRDGAINIFDAFLLNQNWGSQLDELPSSLPLAPTGQEAPRAEVEVEGEVSKVAAPAKPDDLAVPPSAVLLPAEPVTVVSLESAPDVDAKTAVDVSTTAARSTDVQQADHVVQDTAFGPVGGTSPALATPDRAHVEAEQTPGTAEGKTVSESGRWEVVDLQAAAAGYAAPVVEAADPTPSSRQEVTGPERLPASIALEVQPAVTAAIQPALAEVGPALPQSRPVSDEGMVVDSVLAELVPLEMPDLDPLHV